MRLINYDFYDIHALITFFRNNPSKAEYVPAISEIIEYINLEKTINGIDYNTIRKILKPYVHKQDKELSWAFVENEYTANVFIIADAVCYNILLSILTELVFCLKNDGERVCILCDASHNIPLLLADEKHPKNAIISMIKEYRKHYNSRFLYEELKQL